MVRLPCNVAVAAHRAQPGTGAADVATEQREVHDLADGRLGAGVLGDAHRPAHDDPLRPGDLGERLLELTGGQPGTAGELVGVEGAEVVGHGVVAGRVSIDEGAIDDGGTDGVVGRPIDEGAVEPGEEGLIPTESHRQVQIGQLDAAPDHPVHPLGILEADEAGLGKGVHRDDPGAVALGLLEGGEHPGVVRARVLADDDQQVGVMDVVERDAALADADRLGQGDAGGLVTHVRAIGQVVGAESPHEELVEERGLVRRASRGVEEGLIGMVQLAQLAGDQGEGVRPAQRHIVVRVGPSDHRLGEPPLSAQPMVGALEQVMHRVRREEGRGDAITGRFLGDGLGAVLAQLEVLARRGLRPRTARAVEAADLVESGPGADRSHRSHLLPRAPQRHRRAGYAGHPALGRPDAQLFGGLVVAILGHGAKVAAPERVPTGAGRRRRATGG
jgi:hypothetical protein